MATLKKYDFKGKEVGEVQVEDRYLQIEANAQMVKDYIVALRANLRQWSANTKGRKEVNHTGRKPHPQKGQGRARQGCLAAPQYKGGGRVFGPKPKFDQHLRINRKERRLAIGYLLAQKMQAQQVCLVQPSRFEEPKTKVVAQFLQQRQLEGKRVLVLLNTSVKEEAQLQRKLFIQSLRNIPRVEFTLISNVNGYDLMLCQDVIVEESAFGECMAILERIGGAHGEESV